MARARWVCSYGRDHSGGYANGQNAPPSPRSSHAGDPRAELPHDQPPQYAPYEQHPPHFAEQPPQPQYQEAPAQVRSAGSLFWAPASLNVNVNVYRGPPAQQSLMRCHRMPHCRHEVAEMTIVPICAVRSVMEESEIRVASRRATSRACI